MKTIGILTYHSAKNFGANLQLYSTYRFLQIQGFNPIIINWIADDLESCYSKSIKTEQSEEHRNFIFNLNLTERCHDSKDIAQAIKSNNIEAVIIGSDAVVQHHTWRDNISFPSKRFISKIERTSDTLYPNPFWGDFQKYLDKRVPVAYLSASSQNSDYKHINGILKKKMKSSLLDNFNYYSVRDDWTQDMFAYLTDGQIVPAVTPDPVFAINYNIEDERKITKKQICEKYGLPDKYILLSFLNSYTVSQKWISDFVSLAKKDGFECVAFPFPSGILFANNLKYKINTPLPILDWYHLIKYASGYVGQNMHPIVVSLHNSVPFFSFDNYGIAHMKLFVESKSSKIYHILKTAGVLENRFEARNFIKRKPSAQSVYKKIVGFDKEKCTRFAEEYYKKYQENMLNIINITCG